MLQSKAIKAGKTPPMYISNNIINARYNYSLLQERILNHVIFYCQKYIKQIKDGAEPLQLDLFNSMDHGNEINIPIKLSHITVPYEYEHVRECAKQMCQILMSIPVKDYSGARWEKCAGIFTKTYSPSDRKRANYIIATVDVDIAKILVNIDRKKDGTPQNYTTFLYEHAMASRNKYTPRIYKFLSSYKVKQRKYMSVEEMREWLCLKDKYKNTEALIRQVLKPSCIELQTFADLWFDMDAPDFFEKDGKKIVGFNFKVLSPQYKEHYVKQIQNITYMLKSTFKFKDNDLKLIEHIYKDETKWDTLFWRLDIVLDEERKEKKRNLPMYTITSLRKQFNEA